MDTEENPYDGNVDEICELVEIDRTEDVNTMSNVLEYNDKLIIHPGYYIKEIIEESGLTQDAFAKRLDMTPENLSALVWGEQALSLDIAEKLAKMLGTSVEYWLNLQNAYDVGIAESAGTNNLQSFEALGR